MSIKIYASQDWVEEKLNAEWTAETISNPIKILDVQEYTVTANELMASALLPELTLVDKQMYTVEFDGVIYERECGTEGTGDEKIWFIGNLSLADATKYNSEEPFCIIVAPQSNLYALAALDGIHTMGLYEGVECVNKLPNKFINAEWMATKELVKGSTLLPESMRQFGATQMDDKDVAMSQVLSETDGTSWVELNARQNYIVTWNNEEYLCKCYYNEQDNWCCLGDLVNEPFMILTTPSDAIELSSTTLIFYRDPSQLEHQVGIYKVKYDYNKLPVEFMPAGYSNMATKQDIDSLLASIAEIKSYLGIE